jgi:hypothetical protein
MLAATVQPMIRDTRVRSFPWINVFARSDIISGSLELYDLPDDDPDAPGGAQRVENLEDSDATTWLVAHVEYWKNSLVWEKLHACLAYGSGKAASPAAPGGP